jgi:hypothetical protein
VTVWGRRSHQRKGAANGAAAATGNWACAYVLDGTSRGGERCGEHSELSVVCTVVRFYAFARSEAGADRCRSSEETRATASGVERRGNRLGFSGTQPRKLADGFAWRYVASIFSEAGCCSMATINPSPRIFQYCNRAFRQSNSCHATLFLSERRLKDVESWILQRSISRKKVALRGLARSRTIRAGRRDSAKALGTDENGSLSNDGHTFRLDSGRSSYD